MNVSQIRPISRNDQEDYLVTVPCSYTEVNGTRGYFHDTTYKVRPNDTFFDVSNEFYSGQALRMESVEKTFIVDNVVTMHLLCGCVQTKTQVVVTYTVQKQDTLSSIATLLSSQLSSIYAMNKNVAPDKEFIDVGWVLYVPMEITGVPPSTKGAQN